MPPTSFPDPRSPCSADHLSLPVPTRRMVTGYHPCEVGQPPNTHLLRLREALYMAEGKVTAYYDHIMNLDKQIMSLQVQIADNRIQMEKYKDGLEDAKRQLREQGEAAQSASSTIKTLLQANLNLQQQINNLKGMKDGYPGSGREAIARGPLASHNKGGNQPMSSIKEGDEEHTLLSPIKHGRKDHFQSKGTNSRLRATPCPGNKANPTEPSSILKAQTSNPLPSAASTRGQVPLMVTGQIGVGSAPKGRESPSNSVAAYQTGNYETQRKKNEEDALAFVRELECQRQAAIKRSALLNAKSNTPKPTGTYQSNQSGPNSQGPISSHGQLNFEDDAVQMKKATDKYWEIEMAKREESYQAAAAELDGILEKETRGPKDSHKDDDLRNHLLAQQQFRSRLEKRKDEAANRPKPLLQLNERVVLSPPNIPVGGDKSAKTPLDTISNRPHDGNISTRLISDLARQRGGELDPKITSFDLRLDDEDFILRENYEAGGEVRGPLVDDW
ncbi:hypothetical protein ABW19_dt0207296 [Dactylella cylindrospora]|nr:hypothetical protein ABW19_dt0207296 [Dactylella cylindrospora]